MDVNELELGQRFSHSGTTQEVSIRVGVDILGNREYHKSIIGGTRLFLMYYSPGVENIV